MPPKKAKKGGGGAKKKKAAPVKKVTDLTLPPLPSAKTSTLLYAVSSATPQEVGRLVEHYNYGSSLTSVDMNSSTAIHIAAKRGDAAMLEKLLSFKEITEAAKGLINTTESSAVGGYAAIHHVCAQGHVAALQVLLKYGASINTRTNSALGETALHICCKTGPTTMACAKVLLDARADVNAVDKFGHNASYWANNKGHLAMMRELGLPQAHAATPDEFIALALARGLSMPKEKKKAVKGKDGKAKGKK